MALDNRVEVVGENEKTIVSYRCSELACQSNWIFNVLEHVLRDNHVILVIAKIGAKVNAVVAHTFLGDTQGVRLYDRDIGLRRDAGDPARQFAESPAVVGDGTCAPTDNVARYGLAVRCRHWIKRGED